MLPVIFRLGPFVLYSYGVMLVLAFLGAMFVMWKRGRELYFDEEQLFDVVFGVLLVMFISARFGYGLLHFDVYGFQPVNWLNVIGKPGVLYEAGLLGGIISAVYRAKRRKWDVYLLGDALSVGLALALALVSLGALLNGSGYGKFTESFIGMNFPGLYEKRLPVQIFELSLYLVLFFLLWRLESVYRTWNWYKGSKSEAATGFITSVFLMGHGLIGWLASLMRDGYNIVGIRLDLIFYFTLMLTGLLLLGRRAEIKWLDNLRPKQGWGSIVGRKELLAKKSRKERGRQKMDLGKGIFS